MIQKLSQICLAKSSTWKHGQFKKRKPGSTKKCIEIEMFWVLNWAFYSPITSFSFHAHPFVASPGIHPHSCGRQRSTQTSTWRLQGLPRSTFANLPDVHRVVTAKEVWTDLLLSIFKSMYLCSPILIEYIVIILRYNKYMMLLACIHIR